MSFLNLRISGRLYSGFAALLLFCVGLAGFAVWQLGELRTQVAAMTLQSENTIRVGEIAANLQAIRRAILRYAFDHDEKSYTEAETRLKTVGDLLVEADRTTSFPSGKTKPRGSVPSSSSMPAIVSPMISRKRSISPSVWK